LGRAPKDNRRSRLLLFPEKEAKSVSSTSQKIIPAQTSAKPTLGVWGRALKDNLFFFQKKKQKA
jgi:hypothetical protein